jgi:hypothetical protein
MLHLHIAPAACDISTACLHDVASEQLPYCMWHLSSVLASCGRRVVWGCGLVCVCLLCWLCSPLSLQQVSLRRAGCGYHWGSCSQSQRVAAWDLSASARQPDTSPSTQQQWQQQSAVAAAAGFVPLGLHDCPSSAQGGDGGWDSCCEAALETFADSIVCILLVASRRGPPGRLVLSMTPGDCKA